MVKHYENVALMFKDNWVTMEITKIKDLSVSNVKKTLTDLISFLKDYQYFDKIMEIKSNLYNEAINYMKKDVEKEPKVTKSSAADDKTTTEEKFL